MAALNTVHVAKIGDLLPTFQARCLDAAHDPVDLTSATEVRFIMRRKGETAAKVDAVATVVDAPNGLVEYDWIAADVDEAGEFQAEVEVMWPGNLPETFPNGRYATVRFYGDLGGAP